MLSNHETCNISELQLQGEFIQRSTASSPQDFLIWTYEDRFPAQFRMPDVLTEDLVDGYLRQKPWIPTREALCWCHPCAR